MTPPCRSVGELKSGFSLASARSAFPVATATSLKVCEAPVLQIEYAGLLRIVE
jgi:hypothetical protein